MQHSSRTTHTGLFYTMEVITNSLEVWLKDESYKARNSHSDRQPTGEVLAYSKLEQCSISQISTTFPT